MIMITQEDFEKKLRSYINTPFHHTGRVPGLNGGLDCGGMVLTAMLELGMSVQDPTSYEVGDGIDMFKNCLAYHCVPGDVDNIQPGNLVLIRGSGIYHHMFYWTQTGTAIHAWQATGVNKVVETPVLPGWWNIVESVWQMKELEPWQQ